MSFLERLFGGGLFGKGRAAPEPEGDPLRVAECLAVIEEVRPLLRADGGDVELVSVADGRVEVRFVGACDRCAVRESTLRDALEPLLRERLSWVTEVRAR